MPLPAIILPSRVAGRESKPEDWMRTPADTASYLSRGKWWHTRHLDFIAEEIIQLEHESIFLIVTIPPRHGKSQLVSHWTPVWFLKRWPHKHIILCSYQSGIAEDWGGQVRNTFIENQTELGLVISADTKAKGRWQIRGYGGGMLATGIGGPITGRGGDLLIIDDPVHSQEEALSETYRTSAKNWYKATFRTRAQPGASFIILMTRWHEDDLAGWLTSPEEVMEDVPRDNWKVINLPAIAEVDDPLGRKEGEALWPEMYPLPVLKALRDDPKAVGPYWFSAEYQGTPRPEGGSILKEAWFRYFGDEDNPLLNDKVKITRCIQAWDTAFEKGEENSRTACCTWMETKLGYLLMDVWAGRVEFPELVEMVKAKYNQWLPERVYVEHKASGHSLMQQLRRDTRLPILPVKAEIDKAARVHAISGVVEAGGVYLPIRAPWLAEFLHEVCTFPAAKLNDITDAFAHGLMQLKPSRIRTGKGRVLRGKKKAPWRE